MRICLGFGEICGYYGLLHKGFSQLGVESVHIQLGQHPFAYDDDATRRHFLDRLVCRIHRFRVENRLPVLVDRSIGLFRQILIGLLAIDAAIRYDSFIVCAYSPQYKILAVIARLLRKPVITVLHGSDVRPPFINGLYFEFCQCPKKLISLTLKKLRLAKFVESYSTHVVSHAPNSQFLTRPFVNWLRIGIPMTSDLPTERIRSNRSIKIVHAPSRLLQKGTEIFRGIVADLKAKGHLVEFVELIDKNNREVLLNLSDADLVLDELYSDSPMATFATEASYFSCATIACGYIASSDLFLPSELLPPTIFCRPEQAASEVESLLNNVDRLQQVAQKCRHYVKTKWSPHLVALRFMALLKNEVDENSFVDPSQVKYVYGWGMKIQQCQMMAGTFYQHATPAQRRQITNQYLLRFCLESSDVLASELCQ